jgi:hypothetical protein
MDDKSYLSELADSFGRGWNRFWFAPSDPLPCSVLRVAVGLLVLGHLLSLTAGLDRWYAKGGLLPPAAVRTLTVAEAGPAWFHYSWFNALGPTETRVVHGLTIAVAVAFTAGLFPRITGFLTLVGLLAYVHRLPVLVAHVEPVLVFLLAYLVISPADAYFSVSRWLRHRTAAEPLAMPAPSYWATLSLRLVQVHLAAFIGMMGWAKLSGTAWWEGEAIWHLLAQTHSRPLGLTFHRGNDAGTLLINFWTHVVVYYELAFPALIWNRFTRPVLLFAGIAIWLSAILATGLLLFGLTMLAATLAFVPADFYRGLLPRAAR